MKIKLLMTISSCFHPELHLRYQDHILPHHHEHHDHDNYSILPLEFYQEILQC